MCVRSARYGGTASLFLLFAAILFLEVHATKGKKIGIVGAGFSGISAAYHLVSKGYTDITIFESTYRTAGWVSSIKYKNVTHDLSTYALTELYWHFQEIMESLGAEFCPIKSYVVQPRTKTGSARVIDSALFINRLAASTLRNPSTFQAQFSKQFKKYTALWTELYEIPYIDRSFRTDFLFPPEAAVRS